MTDEDRSSRINDIEQWAKREIEIAISVPKRSKPSGGESNILHDVVASMSRRNNPRVAEIEIIASYVSACVDSDYTETERYSPEESEVPESLWEEAMSVLKSFDERWNG